MLRPLLTDVLDVLIPLGVGAVALGAGRLTFSYSPARILMIVLAALVTSIVGASQIGFASEDFDEGLAEIGGPVIVLCWVALALLGMIWSATAAARAHKPLVFFLTAALGALVLGAILPMAIGEPEAEVGGAAIFLVWLAVLAWSIISKSPTAYRWTRRMHIGLAMSLAFLLLIQTAAPLWWRFCAPDMWDHSVDTCGSMRQSTAVTCYPASAAMLLHDYGIAASEGEMAYLAGTSLGGTDDYAIVRALTAKGRSRGLHADTEEADYDTCVQTGGPFIAHVDLPDIGLHAIFVKGVGPEEAEVIDPIDGVPKTISRADFEEMWNGALVRLRRD